MPRRSARVGENSPCGQKESCMLKRIVPLVLALVLCAGLAQAKTKAPATQLPGDLTLAEAQKVLDAALVKAKAQGVPMNIAIVDAGGNLKAFVRQDGAFIGSIDVSTKKAVTARYFNMPTSTLGDASQPGQELFGIEATNGGLVIFGGGELLIRNVIPKHMDCISAKLTEMGVTVEEEDDTLLVSRSGPLQRTNVKTQPYPGFPTDMQPQIAVVLSLAQGTSLVTEGVYGANRFKYMDELRRMGGQVQVDGRVAVIEGVEYLTGAPVQACDLRAGAAMVLAGLVADGVTEITDIYHIDRGYENLVAKLTGLGADIQRIG